MSAARSNQGKHLEMPISKVASTYLNLLRCFAATAVVLYHFQDHHFGPDWLTRYFPSNGSGYVMVFFVISGFVIAMTAEQRTPLEFSIDRAMRIYIVALPVLLITIVLAIYFPEASNQFPGAIEHPISTFFLNALFLCQSWSLHDTPYLDEPYWSLAYEVMYYAIFGAFVYAAGSLRWLLVGALCIVAGPKIIILMPCWLAGVITYRLRTLEAHPIAPWLALILFPTLLVLALGLGLKDWAHHFSMRFTYFLNSPSEAFVRSWIVSIAVAVHLWGVCRFDFSVPALVQSVGRRLAGMSYSLYLLHLPVLHMLAYWWGDNASLGLVAAAVPSVFVICYLFSKITEDRRHDLLEWLTGGASSLMAPAKVQR